MVRNLLQRGADLEARIESTAATPLMLAARAGREQVVELLLTAGANHSAVGNAQVYVPPHACSALQPTQRTRGTCLYKFPCQTDGLLSVHTAFSLRGKSL